MRFLTLGVTILAVFASCSRAAEAPAAADAKTMRARVASFRDETLIRLPGPPASSTPAARALIARGDAAVPFVIEGLSSTDANVRRHSAYVLAKLRPPGAYDPLQAAAARELAHVAADRTGRDPRAVAAPLNMMIIAMSRIDPRRTIAWLVSGAPGDVRELYRQLSSIALDAPVCGPDPAPVCRDRLTRWWEERKTTPPAQLLAPQPWLGGDDGGPPAAGATGPGPRLQA